MFSKRITFDLSKTKHMKKINSLDWYNTNISILDKRLRNSDFDYMQLFAVGVYTMKTLQSEREKYYSIPDENNNYIW